MGILHVDMGKATFYHVGPKLQCQATSGASLSTEAGFGEEVRIDASTLASLDFCYRVARPLFLFIDLSFDDSTSWDVEGDVRVPELLGQQLSSTQFWSQINLAVVSTDLPSDQPTRHPLHIRIRLGLEHVDPGSVSSQTGCGSRLDVNDLNYPTSLAKARIDFISIALRLTVQAHQRPAGLQTSRPRRTANQCEQDSVVRVHSEHLLALVDASLRCFISPARQRLRAGVKRKGVSFTDTLQSLFPAVFSPAGFQYIADRKSLIDGISRNLLNCLGRPGYTRQSSQAPACSSRVQQHTQRLQPKTGQNTPSEGVEALLWRCLMNNATDPRKKVAIKPLVESEYLYRTTSALLSERLSNSIVTHLNQSPATSHTRATEFLLDYSYNGNQSDAGDACWPEDEELLGDARIDCTTDKGERTRLHDSSLQAKRIAERGGSTFRLEHNKHVVEVERARLEFFEDVIPNASRQHDCRSNSVTKESRFLLAEEAAAYSPTLHRAHEEPGSRLWGDAIGLTEQLSKNDTRISSPNVVCTNWEYAPPLTQDLDARYMIDEDDTGTDILSSPKSYLLHKPPDLDSDLFPLFERHNLSSGLISDALTAEYLRVPRTISANSLSEDDLFRITPNSTQDSMPSFQELHRQTKVKTPAEEPTLGELLGDDKGLWDMWQRRGSLGLQSGSLRFIYESDPDMKVLGGHRNRSSSTESMEDTIQRPASAYTAAKHTSSRNSLVKRPSTSSSTASSSPSEKRSSLLRRLSKSSRASSNQPMLDFDFSRIQDRDIEIKRRKTLEDYDGDDDMLFK